MVNKVSEDEIPEADSDVQGNMNNLELSKISGKNTEYVDAKSELISADEIKITYYNKESTEVFYDNECNLELQDNDEWIKIPTLPDVVWDDVEYYIEPGEQREFTFNLSLIFGKLKAGHYRITKTMYTETSYFEVSTEFDT